MCFTVLPLLGAAPRNGVDGILGAIGDAHWSSACRLFYDYYAQTRGGITATPDELSALSIGKDPVQLAAMAQRVASHDTHDMACVAYYSAFAAYRVRHDDMRAQQMALQANAQRMQLLASAARLASPVMRLPRGRYVYQTYDALSERVTYRGEFRIEANNGYTMGRSQGTVTIRGSHVVFGGGDLGGATGETQTFHHGSEAGRFSGITVYTNSAGTITHAYYAYALAAHGTR